MMKIIPNTLSYFQRDKINTTNKLEKIKLQEKKLLLRVKEEVKKYSFAYCYNINVCKKLKKEGYCINDNLVEFKL